MTFVVLMRRSMKNWPWLWSMSSGRPEKDDYRSMVQQCLMHPIQSGIKNGDGLLLFEKKQKEMFISLAQRKGTKETSTPSKASPYIGRMQLTPVRDQPLSEFWYDLRSLCPSGKS